MEYSYKIIKKPDTKEIKKLSGRLRLYNTELIGEYSAKDVLINLHDNNKFAGGGYAIIRLGWVYIDLLWVEPEYRKKGYGKIILEKLEQYAIDSYQIKYARLNTGDFQGAVSFYQHQGYEVFAQLDVFPENARKNKRYIDYYMKKELSNGQACN